MKNELVEGRVTTFDPLFTTSVYSPRALGAFVIVSSSVISLLVDGWDWGAGLFPGQDYERCPASCKVGGHRSVH